MNVPIKTVEDVRWLLGHTGGFRGGCVTDVHMAKRRLFDEGSARDVLTDTTVSVVVRYRLRDMTRVAKLTMSGVTDFSIFEQEGADCSTLSAVETEVTGGKIRFWFDPQGELYIVCEEATFEEVAMPLLESRSRETVARWAFQSPTAEWPTVDWLLGALDAAGLPCTWKKSKAPNGRPSTVQWAGELRPTVQAQPLKRESVHVMLYGPLDGPGFGILLRVGETNGQAASRILSCASDMITRQYSGRCLVGNQIIPGGEWTSWRSLEQQRWIGRESSAE